MSAHASRAASTVRLRLYDSTGRAGLAAKWQKQLIALEGVETGNPVAPPKP